MSSPLNLLLSTTRPRLDTFTTQRVHLALHLLALVSSTSINLHQPPSTSINLHQPPSTSINLYSPVTRYALQLIMNMLNDRSTVAFTG
jgi:hypothetical protein